MKVIVNVPKVKFSYKKQTEDFTLNTDSNVLLKFDQLLKSMKTKKDSAIKLLTDATGNNSTDVEKLEKLFNIDIKNNTEEFMNDDGTFNIFDLINNYGDNLSSNDLREFADTINSLHKRNKISDSDFFYALNWINKKILQKSMTLSIRDKIDKENLKIGDHSKSEKSLHKILKDDSKEEKSSKLNSLGKLKYHNLQDKILDQRKIERELRNKHDKNINYV